MIILHVKVYNLILKTLNKKNQKVRILLNKQLSKYLGIDFGIKKSGVSISDSNKLISFPLETIETKNLLDYVKQININENKRKFFVEEGTVEFSKNNLTILSSTIIDLDNLSKNAISIMIEESKKELKQENIDDKKRYIISHKIDCLSQISL